MPASLPACRPSRRALGHGDGKGSGPWHACRRSLPRQEPGGSRPWIPRTGTAGTGAIAGLAGALWLARFGTVDATAAEGIELTVITSTVVGGVAITGGVGTVVGAVLGALLLSVFSGTLVFLRVPSFWQQAFQGAMLLLAIAVDAYLAYRHALRSRVKWSHV